jgi:ribosomal protein L37E
MRRQTCTFCRRQFAVGNHSTHATCARCSKAGMPDTSSTTKYSWSRDLFERELERERKSEREKKENKEARRIAAVLDADIMGPA